MSLPFQIPILKLQALQGLTESTTSAGESTAECRFEAVWNSNQCLSNNSLKTGEQSQSICLLKRRVYKKKPWQKGWLVANDTGSFLSKTKKIKNLMDFFFFFISKLLASFMKVWDFF